MYVPFDCERVLADEQVLVAGEAQHRVARADALVVAGASKLGFIALVLMQGERYLGGLGVAVAVDSVMVILFALYLAVWRPEKA